MVGALIGLVGAGFGEHATAVTLSLFTTDVAVAGFSLVYGAPASIVVGALCWWRDRPVSIRARHRLIGLPVALVGVLQVWLQWSVR